MSPSRNALATSKSDPTPLNSVLSSPKHIFDDTSPRKLTQKVTPRNSNSPSQLQFGVTNNATTVTTEATKFIQNYIKPKSPMKTTGGILAHNNVPMSNADSNNANTTFVNGKPSSPRIANTISYFNGTAKGANNVKTNRSVSWNQDVAPEKISFTMRREIDKAKEESEMIDQLRSVSTVFNLINLNVIKLLLTKFVIN